METLNQEQPKEVKTLKQIELEYCLKMYFECDRSANATARLLEVGARTFRKYLQEAVVYKMVDISQIKFSDRKKKLEIGKKVRLHSNTWTDEISSFLH